MKIFLNFPQEVKEHFNGIEILILSDRPTSSKDYKTVKTPEEAIRYMSKKDVQEIAVGGGTGAFNAFIDKNLVTDIYLNINPIITGSGGIFVNNNELNTSFEFKECVNKNGFVRQHLTKL